MAHTRVTSAGVRCLDVSRLAHLQLDGCRVSMLTVAAVLRRQPRGGSVWSSELRGHLPRWANIVNSLLVTAPTPSTSGGKQQLRLLFAPEDAWPQQIGMAIAVVALLTAQLVVLAGTLLALLLMPLLVLFFVLMMLLLVAAGVLTPSTLATLLRREAARAETILSAVLVGALCVRVPPPPPSNLLH